MRKRIKINGTVQGVGFRPFVYRMAKQLNITGYVSNTDTGVLIEAQGDDKSVSGFSEALFKYAPPLSEISEKYEETIPENGDNTFSIKSTLRKQNDINTAISIDVATCPDCLLDMFDPSNRRFEYAFTNCTNCGPRFTIIQKLPYDRPFTTMHEFTMCPDCQKEYDDPMNRRFHAQPNACPECGPRLEFLDEKGCSIPLFDPLQKTIDELQDGKIVAIKGLGGFHLAVNAYDDTAVQRLRKRKFRAEKPFAIMVGNSDIARSLCSVNTDELKALQSIQAPIVLLSKLDGGSFISENIAPGSKHLGLMLPYTPVHHLLFKKGMEVLVMTSANRSEEPICIDNDEAVDRLKGIADGFLIHNRDILTRSDDSIMQESAGSMRILRRSRGFVPKPFYLKKSSPGILGLGSDLKNTFCMANEKQVVMSQYIGDLENVMSIEFMKKTASQLKKINQFEPELVVHDMHPGYHSTRMAIESDIPHLAVQHHHAHLAAVCGEYRLDEPVIGIILDGTGYSPDGTIWGGEILIGNLGSYSRFASFEPIALLGGDSAIRNPWKTALSYLYSAYGPGEIPQLPFMDALNWKTVIDAIDKNVNTVPTSSAGRLFDAVAALSGVRSSINYEAQAAIDLMNLVDEMNVEPYESYLTVGKSYTVIRTMNMIRQICYDVLEGRSSSYISTRFHKTMVNILVQGAISASKETGIKSICLNGGVFQNHILLSNLAKELEKKEFKCYIPEKFPMNDGGISFGQVMIGIENLQKGES